jgi:hypothetical protein
MQVTDLIQALIDALTHQRQMKADSAMLRDIVRDNRREMHPTAGVEETKVRVAEAHPIADWNPPGQKVFDALMDAEDAKWRAERALEQAKLGGK